MDTNLAFNSASIIVQTATPSPEAVATSNDNGIHVLQDISIVPASMLDPTTIVNFDQMSWTPTL